MLEIQNGGMGGVLRGFGKVPRNLLHVETFPDLRPDPPIPPIGNGVSIAANYSSGEVEPPPEEPQGRAGHMSRLAAGMSVSRHPSQSILSEGVQSNHLPRRAT
jgi:hypothetical protein